MFKARDFFDKEIWWQTNYGHSNTMYDNWTQLGVLFYLLQVSYANEFMKKNVDYLQLNGKWNEPKLRDIFSSKLRDIFPSDLVDHIINNVEIHASADADYPCWMPPSPGKFLVKSA